MDNQPFLDLAAKRYSVRSFSPRPVTDEELQQILAAGASAPTACNRQPQRFYVAKSAQAMAAVRNATSCHFGAPLLIVVAYDSTISWHRDFDGKDYGEVDATIAITQMMLQIAQMGLGTTFVGWYDPKKLQQGLNLPANIHPVGILPIGHPADDDQPAPMHFIRQEISQFTQEL